MSDDLVDILKLLWPRNKAKGLLAQARFFGDVASGRFGADAANKFFPGCWLLAPKTDQFFRLRFCFFVHPQIIKTTDLPDSTNLSYFLKPDFYRPFLALTDFLYEASFGIAYCVFHNQSGEIPLADIRAKRFETLQCKIYAYTGDVFRPHDAKEFFSESYWPGNRGRSNAGGQWDAGTEKEMRLLTSNQLVQFILNELFYVGVLKGLLKKPVSDPYDVDAFLLTPSQRYILPVELKEKYPALAKSKPSTHFFGIDAGRVMMLLRLCLPNDANALYIIREVAKGGAFSGWKYITLSDIIMTSSWNLQAGGKGMGGQDTQTLRISYDLFRPLTQKSITDENIRQIGRFPEEVKSRANEFRLQLIQHFSRREL